MSFNPALETALSYAALAGDIDSVKALARNEAHRADLNAQLLMAVLSATGPVRLTQAQLQRLSTRAGYTMTQDGDAWVIKLTSV